ncbi:MAG: glycosyltransferase family protein [Anaerolineales bacterium]|nr:glycosyltransferase family protein [Anaerolineales bacterium]
MLPRVIAIIQARMSSSRLPGKVLLDIAGEPMLARVVVRASRATAIHHVLVATTTDASDDPIAAYCDSMGISYTRGSLHDVLDRYYQTASSEADIVVRITADCPVIDPVLIDDCINTLLEGSFDFTCNRLPPPFTRTYPIGLDTEVCTFAALEKAWNEAKETYHREHVMPYLYEGVELEAVSSQLSAGISPRGFKIAQLHHSVDYGTYRWTVDTPEDLEFMRQVYTRFDGRDDFSWKEVLDLVCAEPDLRKINASVKHKTLKDIDGRATGTSC